MAKKSNIHKVDMFLAKRYPGTLNYRLIDHTKMVINLGMQLAELEYNNKYNPYDDKFKEHLLLTLALHDIGKIVGDFQRFLQQATEKRPKYPKYPHKVYSWAFASQKINGLDRCQTSCIKSAILYHHAAIDKKKIDGIDSNDVISIMKDGDVDNMIEFYKAISDYCVQTFGIDLQGKYPIDSGDAMEGENISSVPLYRKVKSNNYKEYQENLRDVLGMDSKAQMLRAILIRADRLVSSNQYDLGKILDNDKEYMTRGICKDSPKVIVKNGVDFTTPEDFMNPNFAFKYDITRLKDQFGVLKRVSSSSHTAINACAGYGKTLLGLMWYFQEKRPLLWVTSRNIIVTNTYRSIKKELVNLGLYDDISIAAYYEGKIIEANRGYSRDELDKFDILVTNIDSIVNRTAKNCMAHLMYNMYVSNVIFDEYHEFKDESPIFSSFIRLMHTRVYYTNSKTLLLSATASDFNCLWGKGAVQMIDDLPVLFGEKKMKVFRHTYKKDDVVTLPKGDVIAICQTVSQACNVYLANKNIQNATLIHTRYIKEDLNYRKDKILEIHGNANVSQRELFVGTSIIGTGIDVSSQILYDEVVSPETTIQRGCGRCSRFGEYEVCEYHAFNIEGGQKYIINKNYTSKLNELWLQELDKYNNQTITKSMMYKIYKDFQNTHRDEINRHYYEFFQESSKELEDIKPYGSSLSEEKDDVQYLGEKGYRGSNNSLYVIARKADGTNEWSDVVVIDADTIDNGNNRKNFEKDIRNYLAMPPQQFEYEPLNIMERKYQLKKDRYTAQACKRFANCSKSPMPLFGWEYSSELGLIEKNSKDD